MSDTRMSHHRRATKRWAGAVACATLVSVVYAAIAAGHSARLIPVKWHPDHYAVPVYFDNGFPGGRARSRVADGARAWTNLNAGLRFVVNRAPSLSGAGFSGPCDTPVRDGRDVSMVYWEPIDGPYNPRTEAGDTAGAAQTCMYGDHPQNGAYRNHLKAFVMVFDKAESWYRKTGNAPRARVDMASVATHEFGHGAGFDRHFKRGAAYCQNNKSQETMCPRHFWGTERQRTLGRHDKHTFRRRYP